MKKRAHMVVVGNAKGGSGKSTTAMHIAIRLVTLGHRVAIVDLDSRQQSLGRYIENRVAYAERRNLALPIPQCITIPTDATANIKDANQHAYDCFVTCLKELVEEFDVVVVDCPGSDTYLARLGHRFADTLVTPINDSFIDLDLLARIDSETFKILSPSWYSEMIWEQRKQRFLQDRYVIDWVVMRNRTSHMEARNKRNFRKVLAALAPRIGFREAAGLGERVIFRELFLKGLTLSDLRAHNTGVVLTMNHVAAHQEIKELVSALRLPKRISHGEATHTVALQ